MVTQRRHQGKRGRGTSRADGALKSGTHIAVFQPQYGKPGFLSGTHPVRGDPLREEAARYGMQGSPTILIDGRDPFAEPGAAASLSCRL